MKRTKHWYLPLNQYQDWFKNWILEAHKDWKKNVYGQCKSWLDQGLQPRAVTRDLDWGVPVPLREAKNKVLYVWFDAPIGYITATQEWAKMHHQDWAPFWKDPKTTLIHFAGKDNIVFHCIIFPTMLKAHGEFILPNHVPANEFLNLQGRKLSTSRNWAVWLHEYLADFTNQQDVLRYVLCVNAPETKDNDFTWQDFQAKNNNELVAILGNFVHRTFVLTHKYFQGIVPEKATITAHDKTIFEQIKTLPKKIEQAIIHFKFREGITLCMEFARIGNKYLADMQPWQLIKNDEERTKTILNIALQLTANMALLFEPFLPFTSKKLQAMLQLNQVAWDDAGNISLMKAGQAINEPALLFEKIENKIIESRMNKLKTNATSTPTKTMNSNTTKENISFEHFNKLDMGIGHILKAEKIPTSNKLLQLTLTIGDQERIIVSGIAQYYTPEAVIGKSVVVVTNLAAKKIMGVTSQGMILMAEDAQGKPVFITPELAIGHGSVVR